MAKLEELPVFKIRYIYVIYSSCKHGFALLVSVETCGVISFLVVSVLGGWDGVKALSTIESYEEKTGSWVTSKTTRYRSYMALFKSEAILQSFLILAEVSKHVLGSKITRECYKVAS